MCFTARFYSNLFSVPAKVGNGWSVWVIVHQDQKPIYAIPERGDVAWNSGTRAIFVGFGNGVDDSGDIGMLLDEATRIRDRNEFCHQKLDAARTEGVKQ